MNHQLSIIIPIFNEAEIIGDLLKHLITHSETNLIKEILVVDGGSTDTSSSIINHFISEHKEIPVRILTSEKGRAKQMNFGAQHAKGEILYFLHADSFPPQGYDLSLIHI